MPQIRALISGAVIPTILPANAVKRKIRKK
nr:MAG TPA: hypothetical protein [Caudoviricetes sp.]